MRTYTDQDYERRWGREAAEWLRRMRDEIAAICAREGWALRPYASAANGYVFKYRGRYNCFAVAVNPVTLGVPADERVCVVQIRFVCEEEAERVWCDAWRYAGMEFDAANFVVVDPAAARAEMLLALLRRGYQRVVERWA